MKKTTLVILIIIIFIINIIIWRYPNLHDLILHILDLNGHYNNDYHLRDWKETFMMSTLFTILFSTGLIIKKIRDDINSNYEDRN